MTIEDQLHAYILQSYKSIRSFSISAKLPPTSVDSVLKRGILKSSITTVLAMCKELLISVDALGDGRIEKISKWDYRNEMAVISSEEENLLGLLRDMNEEGRDKVAAYAHDLMSSDKYKKRDIA